MPASPPLQKSKPKHHHPRFQRESSHELQRPGFAPGKSLLAILALTLGLSACAKRIESHPQLERDSGQLPSGRNLHFDEIRIVARPEAMALRELSDKELFAAGQQAATAGDDTLAVMAFELLADEHPNSPYRNPALFEAGMALLRLNDHAGSLGRFLEAAQEYGSTGKGTEASFRAADAHWHLGENAAALAILERIASDSLADPLKRVEAEVKRAVILLELDEPQQAERLLRAALHSLTGELKDEVVDRALQSRAQFQLAEVFRTYFQQAPLNPSTSSQEKLLADLEYKAQMLLGAQGHYLRCIRLGHAEWATASGYRIGELYQDLHSQLDNAQIPEDLDEEQAALYQEELRDKIQVLIGKAIKAYERTLATALRVGAQNPFVAQSEAQLEKLKQMLKEGEAKDADGLESGASNSELESED